MHCEYKPPGGKLVAADAEVAGGRLAKVQVSGDFFPEPDSALNRLDAALTRLAVRPRGTPGSRAAHGAG